MTSRGATAALTAGLLAGLLVGCSGPRSGSSTTSAVDGCATVLPLARQVVGPRPVLVSVHALRRGQLVHDLQQFGLPVPTGSAAPPTATPTGTTPPATASPTATPSASRLPRVCLVVYRGPFGPGTVTGAPQGASGAYAVLFVSVRHPVVRQVVLTDTLPTGLARS